MYLEPPFADAADAAEANDPSPNVDILRRKAREEHRRTF